MGLGYGFRALGATSLVWGLGFRGPPGSIDARVPLQAQKENLKSCSKCHRDALSVLLDFSWDEQFTESSDPHAKLC